MQADLIATLLISTGIVFLLFAILKTRRLLALIKGNKFERSWQIHLALMVFFILAYFIALLKLSGSVAPDLSIIIGIILLLGSIFVWLVEVNGYRTIKELFDTAVSKEYVENIVQSMADSLIVVQLDAESLITTVNAATLDLLGYSESDLIGAPMSKILGENHDLNLGQRQEIVPIKIQNEETQYRSKSDDLIPVLFSVSEVHNLNGSLDGFIIVGKDFRKLKEARAALEASETKHRNLSNELAQSNTLKDLLLDIITHDIKNPVGVIQGMTELLAMDDAEDEKIQLLSDSTERLLQVLNNATTLSKVAMHESLEKHQLNISELLKSVIRTFQPSLEKAGIEVINEIHNDLTILAHPVVEEVFTNYLSNAAKYATAGNQLKIYHTMEDGWNTLNFADNGETIKVELRDKIFVRSVQLEEGQKRGRGLGLAIVKYIAASLGGEVGVRPNEPQGNIFYIKLPLK